MDKQPTDLYEPLLQSLVNARMRPLTCTICNDQPRGYWITTADGDTLDCPCSDCLHAAIRDLLDEHTSVTVKSLDV